MLHVLLHYAGVLATLFARTVKVKTTPAPFTPTHTKFQIASDMGTWTRRVGSYATVSYSFSEIFASSSSAQNAENVEAPSVARWRQNYWRDVMMAMMVRVIANHDDDDDDDGAGDGGGSRGRGANGNNSLEKGSTKRQR